MLTTDPAEAVAGAHAVYADVWVSMGDEETADERRAALAPYRLDDALLDLAAPGAIALHCLPAHPGEEITAEVLYGPRQRIWEQAENRRHAQKALLELLAAASAARRRRESMPQPKKPGRPAASRGAQAAPQRASASRSAPRQSAAASRERRPRARPAPSAARTSSARRVAARLLQGVVITGDRCRRPSTRPSSAGA